MRTFAVGRISLSLFSVLLLLLSSTRHGMTQEDLKERRLFVPVEDLDALIARDQRGVLLPRDEFLKLSREAQANAPRSPKAPVGAVISGATYSAKFEGEQLLVEARIKIQQLTETWQELSLPLNGMAVERAVLNGQPAKLGRNPKGLLLLNNVRGEQTLTLELSTPLTAVGADKVASVGLLPGIAGTLQVTAPAEKHLQFDGLSLERPAANDQPARYELAVGGQRKEVLIQLSDRQRARTTDALLFANTAFGLRVAPGEITVHAVTTLQVHGTPLDRLVCDVPKTLEITDVDSNGLEAWELSDHPSDANATRITLNYRQPFDGTRRVDFRGVMAVPAGEAWTVPTLKIQQVTSHIGRALLQHAPAIRLRMTDAAGVRSAVLREAELKELGLKGTADAGQVTVLFDLWREDFSLGFIAQPKEQDVQASISSIFDLTSHGLDLVTVATVETSFAPLFELEVSLPAEWLLTTVAVNGQPHLWHVRTREDEPGISHVRIPLMQPLRPGQPAKLEIRAHRDPEGWPVEETSVEVSLPELRLPQSSVTEGTYVIKADDDLDIVPGDITGLDPTNVAIAGARLGFVYQDTRFGGTLKVDRKPSRVSARTLTLARLEKQTLHTRLEVELDISGGGLRLLEIAAPASAGENLRFQLLDSTAQIVEQTSAAGENGERIWKLRLNRHLIGHEMLTVTSIVPRKPVAPNGAREATNSADKNASVSETLPHLRVLAADRQNGFIAIEGDDDQRLSVVARDSNNAPLIEVDPIEIPAPVDGVPSRRIVAAFRYVTGTPIITVSDERFERLPVPTAICQRSKIVSSLSAAGEFQHEATFHFTAVGVQSLQVRLPAETDDRSSLQASLWATLVDGLPVEVRRSDAGYLIPLPAKDSPTTERTLKLFYRTEVPALRGTGELRQPPPDVTVLNGASVSQPLQMLDQKWELHYPEDLLLIESQGAFAPMAPLTNNNWLQMLASMISPSNVLSRLAWIVGVIVVISAIVWARRFARLWEALAVVLVLGFLSLLLLPATHQAREAARRSMLGNSLKSLVFSLENYAETHGVSHADALAAMRNSDVARQYEFDAALNEARELIRNVSPELRESTFERLRTQSGNLAELVIQEAQRGVPVPPMSAAGALSRQATDSDVAVRFTEAFQGVMPNSTVPPAAEPAPAAKAKSARSRPLFADDNRPRAGVPESAPAAVDPQPMERAKEIEAVKKGLAVTSPLSVEGKTEAATPAMDAPAQKQVADLNGKDAGDSQATVADGRRKRAGLLSLTMSLDASENSLTKLFRYIGTDSAREGIGLRVRYENRAAGWSSRWLWIVALAFLAWVSPIKWRRWQLTCVGLGLALPVALVAMAPPAWQSTLDGIFFGSLAAIASCGLRSLIGWLITIGPRLKTKSFWTQSLTSRSAGMLVVAASLSFGNDARTWAYADPPASAPTTPPTNLNPDVATQPTLIVPYDDPKNPLAAERVYLPRAKFIELWNAAHPESRVIPPAPQASLVAESLVVVTPKKPNVEETPAARLTARVTLFHFRNQQSTVRVPLRLASLTIATLNGEPAPLVARDEEGVTRLHVVLDKPGLHVLDLTAEVPINQQGPAGTVTLNLDPLPSGRLIFVPLAEETAFRVNGAANLFRARKGRLNDGPETSYFEVPISAGGDFRLAWQPKQAAGDVDALVQADSQTGLLVEDAGVRLASQWNFKVPRGSINEISFSLPNSLKVRSISGADVGGWELGNAADDRTLKVFLRRAVSDQTSLAFDLFLETHIADEPVAIEIPTFAPQGVSRDFGVVGLFTSPQFALKNIATKGLSQINADQFGGVSAPQWNAANPLVSAFRYTARPIEMRFEAQRKAPESSGAAEHAVVVERRKVRMSSRLKWELGGALRSTVSVQLPPGWLPVDVEATALQDWHLDAASSVLTVEFSEPRVGTVEAVLQGNVPKEPEDLIAEISLPTPLELSKLTTQAAFWFDPAYQPAVTSANGWKTADPEQVSVELRNKLGRPATFVFNSNAAAPEALGFDLPRAIPKLSADTVSLMTVSDTALDYSLALQWKIADAAADTFTFTTPDWLAGKLDFHGPGIRQTAFSSLGEGSGRTRWTITLQDPVASRYFLLATATLPPPTQRSVTTPIVQFERQSSEADANADQPPPFVPLESQRQYVVAINLSSSQLVPAGDLGESVPRDELPIVVDERLVDQATSLVRLKTDAQKPITDIAPPTWTLKTFAIQAASPASINLADLTTVFAADGSWRMQSLFTIKNRSRQFLALQLPEKSQVLSVFVANQPSRLVELKKQGKTYQLIALPKTSEADLSFQVKLILSGRLTTGGFLDRTFFQSQEIELPIPVVVSPSDDKEFGIPVARTLWSVHVPREWSVRPVADPAKTNLTEQSDDASSIGYQSAWLQEANELFRVVEGANYRSSQRIQALNNLKQLSTALQSYGSTTRRQGTQSDEHRKLSESLQEFEAKNSDLGRRIVIDSNNNFFVAKDQQQAEKAQAQARQNANVDYFFFDQLGANDPSQQRRVVTDNNRSLLLGNGVLLQSEDRNGNGVLDPGEDLNGDGLLNLGDVVNNEAPPVASEGRLKFKLNVDSKPQASSKSESTTRSGRQMMAGKTVTEEDRLNRRRQATQQLSELNQAVEGEKLSQQPAQNLNHWHMQRNFNAPAGPSGGGFGVGGFGGGFGGGGLAGGSGGLGGGGLGGMAGRAPSGQPQRSSGINTNASGNVPRVAAGESDEFIPLTSFSLRGDVAGSRWTQAGGLSLSIEIRQEGDVLRFARASGAARLALTVRPRESEKLGWGLIWATVWLVLVGGIVRWLITSSGQTWKLFVSSSSIVCALGSVLLPFPMSLLAFFGFVTGCIALAIGVNRRSRQNTAVSSSR